MNTTKSAKRVKAFSSGEEAKAADPVAHQAGVDAYKEKRGISQHQFGFQTVPARAFEAGWCDMHQIDNPNYWT